jgi:transcriptional regulator with XRE-family HTH domain
VTASEFDAIPARLGVSRAEMCKQIGLSQNAATKYAKGRAPVPRYIEMACLYLLSSHCHPAR